MLNPIVIGTHCLRDATNTRALLIPIAAKQKFPNSVGSEFERISILDYWYFRATGQIKHEIFMSDMGIKTPLYRQVIRDITEKIDSGIYAEGSCLPSRSRLSYIYKISNMTAVKVQSELIRLGIAFGVNGKGLFVSPHQNKDVVFRESTSPLQIVVYHMKDYDRKPHLVDHLIYKSILERAKELEIPFRLLENKRFKFAENEVFIGTFSDMGGGACMETIFNGRLKSVLINNIFTHSYCVVNDNYSGITQLIDYLTLQGCGNLVLATKHFNHLGIANLSERTYAFRNECERRNLRHQVIESGNYSDLLELLNDSNTPDAVMFTTDSPALKFERILAEKKIARHPIITGFDGTLKTVKITVEVDYEAMGSAAVDIVKNNSLPDWSQKDVVRIPCKLRVKV